ncbi:MAG: phenylalanine--tRNA ligase subunit beta [Pseudomonadota bacterium]
MIVSEHWLRDWISLDLSAQEIADRLTHAGLEVDGVTALAGKIDNLVVGKVLEVNKHPDADRLNITRVDIGDSQYEIVCGAANVRVDLMVAVALVGAKLPNGLKIKQAKVRGVESNGMLCSASELGLEEQSDGLIELGSDAKLGQRVDEYLRLDDHLIDIDLTPNRGDCLSVQGIARELRVLADGQYHPLEISATADEIDESLPVEVQAEARCPRYLGRVIKGVDVSAQTPIWMQERLRRSGLRPISPIVDITNYVLMELGQPMHAFDLHKLNGGIVVREAKAGETISLLDGTEATLDAQTLVIADHKSPVAIAGVMGGADSAIDSNSTDIVFEAAHFTRSSAAGAARRYGLHTDSSHRYERGVDPELPTVAMNRATELVLEICGGKAGPIVDRSSASQIKETEAVAIRFERLQKLLGMQLDRNEIADILARVSEKVSNNDSGWVVQAPSYRFDIEFEADLIEEIARVKGYDSIPLAMPRIAPQSTAASEASVALRRIRQTLTTRDFYEVISYSFIDPAEQAHFDKESPVKVTNPLAENMSVMRTSLLPGLIKATLFNQNRQKDRIRLFEMGASYHLADDGYREDIKLSGLVTGSVNPVQWGAGRPRKVDFFDLKSDLQAILSLTGFQQDFIFNRLDDDSFHPGQSASIEHPQTGAKLGKIGRLHPRLEKALDLSQPVFVFELDVASTFAAVIPEFRGISKFPESSRDLSIIVNESVSVADVFASVRKVVAGKLARLDLFDVYQGDGVDKGSKSISFSLAMRDADKTLTDEETQMLIDAVLSQLENDFGARLR